MLGGGGRGGFPPIEPYLVGLIPEVVLVTDLEGGVTEEPLPEA